MSSQTWEVKSNVTSFVNTKEGKETYARKLENLLKDQTTHEMHLCTRCPLPCRLILGIKVAIKKQQPWSNGDTSLVFGA